MKSTPLDIRRDHMMRVEIGRRLRQIRKSKGWLGDAVAKRTTITRTRLSRLENGLVKPRIDELTELLDAMRADEREKAELLRILDGSSQQERRARHVLLKTPSNRQARLQQLETRARHVFIHAAHVPVLLQTIPYMHLVTPIRWTARERSLAMRVALDRQQLLHDPSRTFVALLAPGALQDPRIDPTTRADLIAHLRRTRRLPSVTIGIVEDRHWPTGPAGTTDEVTQLDGQLVIVSGPTDQVEVEGRSANVHIDAFRKLSEVAMFDEAFDDRLQSAPTP